MFKDSLKKLREEKNLSQEVFARAMGIAQSTVGNWESGTRMPNIEMTQKVADFFNVSVDYLIGRKDISIQDSSIQDSPAQDNYIQENERYQEIIEKTTQALFFDDEISDRDKETIFKNISDAFWKSREISRR